MAGNEEGGGEDRETLLPGRNLERPSGQRLLTAKTEGPERRKTAENGGASYSADVRKVNMH